MHALQKEGDHTYRLEAFDFGRRMAVEREYRAAAAAASAAPPSNVLFDASGKFLIYPSVVGIKIISVGSSKLARLLGKVGVRGFERHRTARRRRRAADAAGCGRGA